MTEEFDAGAEFSRITDCSGLGRSMESHKIEADEDERAALAGRLDLLSLEELKAEIDLARTSDGLVRMKAKFRARLVQSCVVAFQPVHQELEETFELLFKEEVRSDGNGTPEVTLEDELWPEPLVRGRVDIGEAVSQQLALALDPYPRAPGAVFEASVGPEIKAEPRKPLADLGKLVSFGQRKDGS